MPGLREQRGRRLKVEKARDFRRFVVAMAALDDVFGDARGLSETRTEVYFRALADLDIAQFERGVESMCKDRVYPSFPKPAEIKETVHGNKADNAILAWDKVLRGIIEVGPYPTVQFDDPVIHSAIEAMGGWEQICNMETGEARFIQKEFERLYLAYQHKAEHPQLLPGLVDTANVPRGYDPQKVVWIGGPETMAVQIRKGGAEIGKANQDCR